MKVKISLIVVMLSLALAASNAEGKDKKKKQAQRGMLESMQSVPCGAKERGVTGLGSVFASVGVEHVNSHEQLCPQYLFRTDEMEYHIRPMDLKHATLLPVGHEGEFKIKKDRLFLKVPEGDKQTRAYQVVSMQPITSESKAYGTTDHPAGNPAVGNPAESRPPTTDQAPPVRDGDKATARATDPPPAQH
jgi:hypothetical protein